MLHNYNPYLTSLRSLPITIICRVSGERGEKSSAGYCAKRSKYGPLPDVVSEEMIPEASWRLPHPMGLGNTTHPPMVGASKITR